MHLFPPRFPFSVWATELKQISGIFSPLFQIILSVGNLNYFSVLFILSRSCNDYLQYSPSPKSRETSEAKSAFRRNHLIGQNGLNQCGQLLENPKQTSSPSGRGTNTKIHGIVVQIMKLLFKSVPTEISLSKT